jgi:hypothetical protein
MVTLLIKASSKKAVSMVEGTTRIPRLERTKLVSFMAKVITSYQTKRNIGGASAMGNVMVRVLGGKIQQTLIHQSIVESGNTASSMELGVLNGEINVHTTRVNFTWVLNMVVDH